MILHFADCTLDSNRHEFLRSGAAVHLEPQVFDLLQLLAERAGELVSHDDLIASVWRGLNVSDATISARISAARAAVGDTGRAQAVIQTVPRRGIRMIVPVDVVETPLPRPSAAMPAARQTVSFADSADGARIAYAQSGSGPPVLRAGHWLSHLDMDWSSPIWRPMIDAISANHTLYRYDQRGTGLSDRRAALRDLSDFVADFAAVADAAALDRFSIYAPSQSAPVALRYAAENPDRVERVAILGGYAEGRAHRGPAPDDVDEETMLALIRSGWGRRGSTFVKAFSSLFMPDATPGQVDNFVDIQLNSASPEVAVRLRRAVDRFNVWDLLGQVQAPVLVMHAAGDVIHPLSQGRLLAGAIPDARLFVLDSDNHVPLPQHPSWEMFIHELLGFLRGG